MEQELGLAAYFVSSEAPPEKVATSEALESDAEKLSSTDNEEEELGTEGEAQLHPSSLPPGVLTLIPRLGVWESSCASACAEHSCRLPPTPSSAGSQVPCRVDPLGESGLRRVAVVLG